jgi:hypothetical protein
MHSNFYMMGSHFINNFARSRGTEHGATSKVAVKRLSHLAEPLVLSANRPFEHSVECAVKTVCDLATASAR